jgi:hypothetical protein
MKVREDGLSVAATKGGSHQDYIIHVALRNGRWVLFETSPTVNSFIHGKSMQLSSLPAIVVPPPIIVPSAPILPEQRLVFGGSDNLKTSSEEPPSKKRKKDRACDYCRRRKIKCDGPWRDGHVCTNCLHGHRRCTYLYATSLSVHIYTI